LGGIYLIICIVNNYFYVGRAKCYQKRIKDHLRDLRKGHHKNPIIQSCFNKYGEENFKYSLLISLPDDEYIHKEIEQLIIDKVINDTKCMNINRSAHGGCLIPMTEERKYKISKANKGKNKGIRRDAKIGIKISNSLKGHVLSNETKKKISNSHTGKSLSDEHRGKLSKSFLGEKNHRWGMKGEKNPLSHAILQIDPKTLTVINTFIGIRETSRKLGLKDSSGLGKILKGKRSKVKGYYWCYIDEWDCERKNLFEEWNMYFNNNEFLRIGQKNGRSKPIIQLTVEGKIIRKLPSGKLFEQYGFDCSMVHKVCKGKSKSHKGYKFKYSN
jgi:group I intron endonuclease